MVISASKKIFVGYDTSEDIAWEVCRHSLLRHADNDLVVIPLRQAMLRELGLYTRSEDVGASTEFSLTRFLTPYLAAQEGWVVFCDCDFLFRRDVRAVFEGLDPTKALYCVQHDYTPAYRVKMDGKKQASYPRKNWSSFMVFNCDHPDVRALTPAVVNSAAPAYLHQFKWIGDDRARHLVERHQVTTGPEHDAVVREIRLVDRRIHLIARAILLLVLAGLSIGLTVVLLFVEDFAGLELKLYVATTFILALGLLMGGLLLFLRETREAAAALRIPETYLELERKL